MQFITRGWKSAFCLLFVVYLANPCTAVAQGAFLGRSLDEWRDQFNASKGQQKVDAAWAIAQMAGRNTDGVSAQFTVDDLSKLAKDADPSIRYWGAAGLALLGKQLPSGDARRQAAIRALADLLQDNSPAPRIAAAGALSQLGQAEKAVPVLLTAMNDPQESVRIQAVAALEPIASTAPAIEQALRKATTDSSEYVKRISERALSQASKK
jgi:uncharacterized protein (DUF2336 family)